MEDGARQKRSYVQGNNRHLICFNLAGDSWRWNIGRRSIRSRETLASVEDRLTLLLLRVLMMRFNYRQVLLFILLCLRRDEQFWPRV